MARPIATRLAIMARRRPRAGGQRLEPAVLRRAVLHAQQVAGGAAQERKQREVGGLAARVVQQQAQQHEGAGHQATHQGLAAPRDARADVAGRPRRSARPAGCPARPAATAAACCAPGSSTWSEVMPGVPVWATYSERSTVSSTTEPQMSTPMPVSTARSAALPGTGGRREGSVSGGLDEIVGHGVAARGGQACGSSQCAARWRRSRRQFVTSSRTPSGSVKKVAQ